MDNSSETKVPIVFISYSHDSPAHRKWVAHFAEALMKNGVNVILDQWDLELGDDVTRFMEQAVVRADRVLMVCSEQYVQKANDGKGGVGYEKMIVTGELVDDLGTSKFIPVIRQSGSSVLPAFLKTRIWIDFSDDEAFEERLTDLLRALHNAPAARKPHLGVNPFHSERGQSPDKPHLVNVAQAELSPASAHSIAIDIARANDQLGWRKLVQRANKVRSTSLEQWAGANRDQLVQAIPESADQVVKYLDSFGPLIAIALAGVESGDVKLNKQTALLDEIIHPKNWNLSGYTSVVDIPYAGALAYHSLHGALCMQTRQHNVAVDMARTHVDHYNGSSAELFKIHSAMGWVETLGGNCKVSWGFLKTLPERWPWLNEVLGEKDEFVASLYAYYLLLNIVEFAGYVADGHSEAIRTGGLFLDVPLMGEFEADSIKRRAYRLLVDYGSQYQHLWSELGVNPGDLASLWPDWLNLCKKWVGQSNLVHFFGSVTHARFFDDLIPPKA